MMIKDSQAKARQIRAARALLDWSQENLAKASDLSVATIRKLELGRLSLRSKTMQAIRHAFEGNGLEFIEPGGVRHRIEGVVIHRGQEGLIAFLDEVYQTSKARNEEINI